MPLSDAVMINPNEHDFNQPVLFVWFKLVEFEANRVLEKLLKRKTYPTPES